MVCLSEPYGRSESISLTAYMMKRKPTTAGVKHFPQNISVSICMGGIMFAGEYACGSQHFTNIKDHQDPNNSIIYANNNQLMNYMEL